MTAEHKTPGVHVRDGGPDDAEALYSLSVRAIQTSAAEQYTPRQLAAWAGRRTLEQHQRMLESTHTVVAVAGERIVGFSNVALVPLDELVPGEVDQLFVDPDHGGRGIARRLLSAVADMARAQGIDELVTHASWRAVPVFEAAGYSRAEVESVTIEREVLTRVRMRRALREANARTTIPAHTLPSVDVLPADVRHLELLVSGAEAFEDETGLRVADGYCPFDGAVEHALDALRNGTPPRWSTHLFIDPVGGTLLGLGGFTGPPEEGIVEIGYSVAPSFQGAGYATAAALRLIEQACAAGVSTVVAHTLAAPNASTRVLERLGFVRTAELSDLEDGDVWRWERGAAAGAPREG